MRERARSGSRGRMNRDQPEQWLHLVPGAAAQSRHAATAHGTSVPRTITRSPRRSASILSNIGSLNIHSLPRSNRFELFQGCSVLLLPLFGVSSMTVINSFAAFLAFFGERDTFERDGYTASHRQVVPSCCRKEN